jgi:hypothetical protein
MAVTVRIELDAGRDRCSTGRRQTMHEEAMFGQNAARLLGSSEILLGLRICPQLFPESLAGCGRFEVEQRQREVVGTLLRHEIPHEMAAAALDNGRPALRVLFERAQLIRINRVVNAARHHEHCHKPAETYDIPAVSGIHRRR